MELNQRNNVSLFNVALGQAEGEVFLSDDAGSATNHIEPVQSERTVAVRCIRIDTVCSEHAIHPQYVKIDVEGFEYDVLAGFGSFLKAIDLLMIEMNGLSDQRSHGQRQIHELLRAHGSAVPCTATSTRSSCTQRRIRHRR